MRYQVLSGSPLYFCFSLVLMAFPLDHILAPCQSIILPCVHVCLQLLGDLKNDRPSSLASLPASPLFLFPRSLGLRALLWGQGSQGGQGSQARPAKEAKEGLGDRLSLTPDSSLLLALPSLLLALPPGGPGDQKTAEEVSPQRTSSPPLVSSPLEEDWGTRSSLPLAIPYSWLALPSLLLALPPGGPGYVKTARGRRKTGEHMKARRTSI